MKRVLITGCGSGFGYLSALDLARHGHRVYATVRDPAASGAAQLRTAATREELPLSVHHIDVTDPASISDTLAEARAVDVLVNNAGWSLRGPVVTVSDEEIHQLFDTNVYGPLRMIRAVVPDMCERRSGAVVNVTSIAGSVGAPYESAYAASKHALEALSEALRIEAAPYGVRVTVVAPGGYATPIADKARVAAAFRDDHPDRPRYDRFWEAFRTSLHPDGQQDPAEVVAELRAAVEDPDASFRRMVGTDAQLLYDLKRRVSFEEFESQALELLGLREGL